MFAICGKGFYHLIYLHLHLHLHLHIHLHIHIHIHIQLYIIYTVICYIRKMYKLWKLLSSWKPFLVISTDGRPSQPELSRWAAATQTAPPTCNGGTATVVAGDPEMGEFRSKQSGKVWENVWKSDVSPSKYLKFTGKNWDFTWNFETRNGFDQEI